MRESGGRSDGWRVVRLVAAAAVASFALAVVSGAAGEESAWAASETTAASGSVHFVPLGKFPRGDANKLARHVRSRFGLRTQVLGSVAVPRSMLDRARKQYVAQKLIGLLSRPSRSQAVVIGLTVEDMYSASEAFRFVFSLRSPQGFAVVSRARMDPRALALFPDPALRMRRLQKMVLKNVGSLALGHPLSGNPRSVMFGSILSVDDLDYMTQEVRPAAPTGTKQRWLAGSNRVCKSATSREVALWNRSNLDTQEGFVAFIQENIDLRERHRSELAAVPAAPEDRGMLRALQMRFKGAVAADRAALSKLEASWSQRGLGLWAVQQVRLSATMKASALELGSRACGRYFDPQING
jgi:predicted Zn-dependent protease